MPLPTSRSPIARWGLLLSAGALLASCGDDARQRNPITGPAALPPSLVRASAVGKSFTLDADFDQGTLVNVNHDAPNGNQLQLNSSSGTVPFIWVALSQRCTIA
jgi:hypothetical protein